MRRSLLSTFKTKQLFSGASWTGAGLNLGIRKISCTNLVLSTDIKDNDKMDKLQENPYFEKYAKKISKIQRTSPEEFLSRIEALNKTASKSNATKLERGFSNVGSPNTTKEVETSYQKSQRLDSIMKIDLIKDQTAEDISKLWIEYHQGQDKIAAVIPTIAYTTILQRSKKCPTFLYPLPREQGFEFIMSQFDGHTCHFTSLVNYQAFKANAPECLSINHFTELRENKGIVLMRGEYVKEVLSGSDALFLANQLKLYYTASPGGSKHQLLTCFTQSPGSFKHTDLINELQNFAL